MKSNNLSVLAEIGRGLVVAETALDLVDQATRMADGQTSGLTRADHVTALASQASALQRDLGREQLAVERQPEAVSAARELGLQVPLARQLQYLASRLIDAGDAEEAAKTLDEATAIAEAEGQDAHLRGTSWKPQAGSP